MKIITKMAAVLAAALLIILTALPAAAVTTGIEVIGEATGLVLTPAGGSLFDFGNMNPGDTRQGTIKLKNNYSRWYHLWLRAGDITAEEPSLFEVMELTVVYRDKVLYRGLVEDFAGEPIYLGRFQPGESGELAVTVHLPGPETGNEYQGKSASVKWIFTAQASEEIVVEPEEPGVSPEEPGVSPDLPKTYGEGALYLFSLLGTLSLLTGVQLARRCKRR